jgi:(p)ppGpp synthase/HD superfamily hydrolase
MTSVPAQLAATPGAKDAVAFLLDAYRTRVLRPGRTVEHPIAVAGLLASQRHPAPVVIVGLMHDVLEDSDVAADELLGRFGPEVSRLVEALTQTPPSTSTETARPHFDSRPSTEDHRQPPSR